MSVFVDWITISQRHPGRLNPETGEVEPVLPLVDDGILGKFGRGEDGEYSDDAEWASQSAKNVTGSFSTLIRIKSDGYRVTLSGNIGRLDRPDNLFNLSFDATIQRCNQILARFGLPPFTAGERVINQNPSAYDLKHGLLEYWTGACISRLDMTRNYATGSAANAQATVDWLATQSISRVKRGRAGETTVTWGDAGSRKKLIAYIKYAEMLAHPHGRKREEIEADPVYQYCLQEGVVRLELKAGRLMLRDNLLRYLGDITMEKLTELYDAEVIPLVGRVKTDVTRMELEHLPASVRVTAAAYLRGENVRALMSRATFYRHASQLREYGLDIAEPLPTVSKFASVINVIQIHPMECPDWYWNHQRKMQLSVIENASDVQQVA
ncbi:phage/plasmid replication domain-containing protein [Chromobacterium subtsugae]|uniref:phage/plasmid replication domain-containing protein n=1 Tax=Chromobacterium subtsugae TaxID=251747 RepID=UPI0006413982|nr:phage/plasmid replication protein [Chromobacterium subtsugae]